MVLTLFLANNNNICLYKAITFTVYLDKYLLPTFISYINGIGGIGFDTSFQTNVMFKKPFLLNSELFTKCFRYRDKR